MIRQEFTEFQFYEYGCLINRNQRLFYWWSKPYRIREGFSQHPEPINWLNYLELLLKEIILNLVITFPNHKETDILKRNISFQHDGVPPYFERLGLEFLDAVFSIRSIGREETLEWLVRSHSNGVLFRVLPDKQSFPLKPANIVELKEEIMYE